MNKGGVTKSSAQRTTLTDEEYKKIMLGCQYKMDANGDIKIIDPVTLAEQDLANINLKPKSKLKQHTDVRGGKSKRKKSRSKKYKKRRVNKTRRYRK